jgi:hypothetical protein
VVFYGERLFVCLAFTVISLPPSGLLRDLHQGWVDCAATGSCFQLVLLLLHFLDTAFFFPFDKYRRTWGNDILCKSRIIRLICGKVYKK